MKLPSLLAFQPHFYRGGAIRHYFAPLYDLVATLRPRRVVVVGFGEGEAFFTLCQAVQENHLGCECFALGRGTSPETDTSWQEGMHYAAETYREFAHLLAENSTTAARQFAEKKVDLLLLDHSDRGSEIAAELQTWNPVLSSSALVLVHGIELQREDAPKPAWRQWNNNRVFAEFAAGIGLGISWPPNHPAADRSLLKELSAETQSESVIAQLYALAAARIEAQAQAAQAQREATALATRQVWLDSLLEDRWAAQSTMDEQAEQLSALRRDRAKAQLVMDGQHEQLRHWLSESETRKKQIQDLKAELREQKRILNEAKSACRKRGKCFHPAGDAARKRRPLATRIARELQRIPANLGLRRSSLAAPPPTKAKGSAAKPKKPIDRYAAWQEEREPNESALDEQRRAASLWSDAPKISFLLPVQDPPAKFLDALLASLAAQTAPNWEVCLVDGGSERAETQATIER